jgi:Protein of unknown function (DUF1579)
MDMPTPTAEHKLLSRLGGEWAGTDVIHPSRWDPAGGSASSRYRGRMDLGGFYLLLDAEQERGGVVSYQAHGVFGWDARGRCYTMHWFDNVGIDPGAPAIGSLDGDVLTFTHEQRPFGYSRYVFVLGDDEWRLRIENSTDGVEWAPFLDGTYRPV